MAEALTSRSRLQFVHKKRLNEGLEWYSFSFWYRTTARILLFVLVLFVCAACSGQRPVPGVYGPDITAADMDPAEEVEYVRLDQEIPPDMFAPKGHASISEFASEDDVESFSDQVSPEYRLGPGDQFSFIVRGREDISVENVIVSPDGRVALPRIGVIKIQDMTLDEATFNLEKALERYYEFPDVTLAMEKYNNNKVYVLGRVSNPGAVHFHGQGTVLEALALAGGLPVDTQKSFLSRCMIIRGNEMVMWIDLRGLLQEGNMALNARLQNNDVLFIPQSEDSVAYVMGEVLNPGVLMLRSEMTVMDALMNAGGITKDANPREVYLVRWQRDSSLVQEIDLTAFVQQGDLRRNYVLREGDILYVSQRGMSRFNYFMTQLLPSFQVIDFGLEQAERLGAMQELRRKIWGQEGFVGN
ncbi:SLBB domain-containing protein [Desulfonatronovibrio magnus]|uniref:SLBB domain-containing protein n=1 Tax=Desulfonatronovibrio magnus TaxID=698827 RepID=UPI0018DD3E1A|nr:polysaccharide biosynthesis/export family protein [Desulfonatronovibrio magnus]